MAARDEVGMLSTVIIPHSLVTSVSRPLGSLPVWALLGAQLLVSPMGEAPAKPWPVQAETTGCRSALAVAVTRRKPAAVCVRPGA